jgi:hypothetical protein
MNTFLQPLSQFEGREILVNMRTSPRYSSARGALSRAAAATAVVTGVMLISSQSAFALSNDLTNGNFALPGGEGATPTEWAPTNFGAETAPYDATIGTYDVDGAYPPPSGQPGGNVAGNYAVEDFYEAGDDTGIEGFGGVQALSVASSTDPQISWYTAQTFAPATSVASWAASSVTVDFTNASTNYQLVYLNPFTPSSGTYSANPTASNTTTTKYLVLSTLSDGTWYQQPLRDLPTDVAAQFGLSTFTVTGIEFGNLELTTSSGSPYPNMTSYWDDISLTGAPATALPESSLVAGLPLVGIGALGVFVVVGRRRRQATA